MYPPLIKHNIRPKKLLYTPTATIVGNTGAGKTSLVNKLCGTDHDAGAGKGSLTQNLFRNDVAVGMYAFNLIDTPGTDSSTDTYKHAILLREGLTAFEINTIFVIVKFENRFQKMTENFYSQPVNMYAKKIVVMISHLDQSKNAEKEFKEIRELFAEECPDIANIIFYSEESETEVIAEMMFSCISNMEPKRMEISDEEFHFNFNCFKATQSMKQSLTKYTNEANKMANDYTNYIFSDELNTHPANEKDEILHMMLVSFKNELDDMYDQFVEKHGTDMNEMNHYTFLIMMQKENVKLCDKFTTLVIELMSYNLFDNEDPRNLIKKCPHCGEIWYKVEGCDGPTTCGNSDFITGSSIRYMYNYVLTNVNGKIRVYKKSIEKPTPIMTKAASAVSSDYYDRIHETILYSVFRKVMGIGRVFQDMKCAVRTGYKGCGAKIVFRDLPKLDDELILSLYKVKTMDEAKQMIKSENFQKTRRNYERDIDNKFHV